MKLPEYQVLEKTHFLHFDRTGWIANISGINQLGSQKLKFQVSIRIYSIWQRQRHNMAPEEIHKVIKSADRIEGMTRISVINQLRLQKPKFQVSLRCELIRQRQIHQRALKGSRGADKPEGRTRISMINQLGPNKPKF